MCHDTAPPCIEVIDRFCKEGLIEQQSGGSFSDNMQTLQVYCQAYKETLEDHKTKLSELQSKIPEPDKWADKILNEGEGIREAILTHIKTADHKSLLPHSVCQLRSNLSQVVKKKSEPYSS